MADTVTVPDVLLAIGAPGEIVLATITSCLAIVALAAGVGGWVIRRHGGTTSRPSLSVPN